ncbi:MAG: NlpC/P60 family protein [Fimbriimonadaceae bacterium]|nr:NlpC/P60 family protein [Fimbriimonadaceae bacterium]
MTHAEAFETLGLQAGANESEIRQAYRDLAQVWHPDRFQHSERLQAKASERFKAISLAYELIRESGWCSPPAKGETFFSDRTDPGPQAPEAEVGETENRDEESTDAAPEGSDSPQAEADHKQSSRPEKRQVQVAQIILAAVACCALVVALSSLRGTPDSTSRRPNTSQGATPNAPATSPDDAIESAQDATLAPVTPGEEGPAGSVRVLGRLGQALEPVSIFANADKNSPVYYQAKKFEYLVIQDFKFPQWRKVLLQNGKFGYVPSELVAALPYEVTMDRTSPRMGLSSRSAAASAVANQSLRYTGTPYKAGGNDLDRGVDSSGFVKLLFRQVGVDLPRTAAEQVKVGEPVTKLEDLEPGDRLYFWDAKSGNVGHTGIYVGNGYFSHASETKREVCQDYLGDKKWLETLVAARR